MQSHIRSSVAALVVLASPIVAMTPAAAQELPAIKASAANIVPACTTPGRLQAFLAARNTALEPRFKTIAVDYMREGEALGVRWDFAFFQMILETGQLTFKNGARAGDVKPVQHNFAGLGATGGVPGESFPDVTTGVRAHLQHVLVYAGETPDNLVAERTRNVLKWGVLTDWQKGFKKPITFTDMATRWAPKSTGYAQNLEQIADQFATNHCKSADPHPEYLAAALARNSPQKVAAAEVAVAAAQVKPADAGSAAPRARQALVPPAPLPEGVKSSLGPGLAASGAVQPMSAPAFDEPVSAAAQPAATKVAAAAAAAPKAAPQKLEAPAAQPLKAPAAKSQAALAAPAAAASAKCRVWTASYGGQRAVIIRSTLDSVANFTVLDVNEGQEAREAEAFISAYAKGGMLAGAFPDQSKALDKAFELCPEG
jgi:Mannosyl-glycoprotein endo-beta-N-acetylglucosaminidase